MAFISVAKQGPYFPVLGCLKRLTVNLCNSMSENKQASFSLFYSLDKNDTFQPAHLSEFNYAREFILIY